MTADAEPGVWEHVASACGGDIRKAMNAVELLFSTGRVEEGKVHLSLEDAKQLSQRTAMRYDKDGDDHYDCLSALMKSIRGSDPDAAIHYLARFLEAGDLAPACRRILCSACEDIGLAYPQAIPIVKACVDSALQLGLPEARLPLADAVILLATAPKSNSGYRAIAAAMADVKAGRSGPIPRELQNVHADGTGFEREQGYLYPHDYPGHWVKQQYLPDAIRDRKYYEYGQNKTEQAAKRYWDEIKKQSVGNEERSGQRNGRSAQGHSGHEKTHPCGECRWEVLRTGMDFRLRCLGCGREVMLPRSKAEKGIRQILRNGESVPTVK